MENTVVRQFVMLSLHPEKGRIIINDPYLRYSIIGAFLMDLLNRGEISIADKRMTHTIRMNGDPLHDRFAEVMKKSSRPRRFSYWIRRFSMKSRLILKDTLNFLISNGILRHERRYFLNIIPYNRYFFTDIRTRNEIVEGLRGVLLYGREPSSDQRMLIALLKASSAHSILAREKGERSILRKKCEQAMEKNEMATELDKVIHEVRTAISTAVMVSAATSSGIH